MIAVNVSMKATDEPHKRTPVLQAVRALATQTLPSLTVVDAVGRRCGLMLRKDFLHACRIGEGS
ncbi:hypothetical protein [Lamprobacter modestohalophilus]|uniref:hypothetical protein n=1 Tax=Lamprobacter modestohalophilus TaxID=1064514 RepID=UPI001903DDC9|nr:hypothetical protein [Lamprobacter modestohalophilus]